MKAFFDWLFTTPWGALTFLGAILVLAITFMFPGGGRHRR